MANPQNFPVLSRQFVRLWGKALGAETIIDDRKGPLTHFKTLLSGLYLRGFEEAECVLLAPFLPLTDLSVMALSARRNGEVPPLVACLSHQQRETLEHLLPRSRSVLLWREIIADVLSNDITRNREALRSAVRNQMPLKRLSPYQTTRPVAGEMFFGREHELDLLCHDEADCLLITGPSKIGKTSLLHQYRWSLRRDRDFRLSGSFAINLQPCANRSPDEVARFFAMEFRDVPYTTEELKFRDLRSFLYSVTAAVGGPLEIILDEADAVCHMDLLLTVAEFASSSRSRLIVIGRGAVRRFWRKHQATAFGRLRDMRCNCLGTEDAWQLFQRPMDALGLRIQSPDLVKSLVLQQTSRMPHLVQGCARAVVELAAEINASTVTPTMLHRAPDSFFDFSLLRSHLEDLASDRARLAAIEVLAHYRKGIFTVQKIQLALRQQGFPLAINEVTDLCDDLLMNCILTWDDSGYGPPRWDICEAAERHPAYLATLGQECLNRMQPNIQ